MKENKKGKLQAIPPQTIWAVQGLFNLEQVGSDFLLECGLPRNEIRCLTIKDQGIPFIPQTPSTNHEDFHKERVRKDPLIVISFW